MALESYLNSLPTSFLLTVTLTNFFRTGVGSYLAAFNSVLVLWECLDKSKQDLSAWPAISIQPYEVSTSASQQS